TGTRGDTEGGSARLPGRTWKSPGAGLGFPDRTRTTPRVVHGPDSVRALVERVDAVDQGPEGAEVAPRVGEDDAGQVGELAALLGERRGLDDAPRLHEPGELGVERVDVLVAERGADADDVVVAQVPRRVVVAVEAADVLGGVGGVFGDVI